MGCGIYKIQNTVNGKIYIGSSVNLESREYKHFWMLGRNNHDNEYLQHSYNKYGKESFKFEVIEECVDNDLINRENYYIDFYRSNILEFGFNLAKVNEFRRNTYNDDVKIKLSKSNLTKNNNFTIFSLTNIETNEEFIFNSLVEGANYLIENNFTKSKPRNVRMKISNSLRGVKVNNGKNGIGTIRKTCFKHNFKILI